MITVFILENDDIIEPNDWCRPLNITSMSGMSDSYSFKSMYSGSPENNVEWVRVKCVVGEGWIGKTVKEYNVMCKKYRCPMEFIRGNIPKAHQLNMKGYNDMSKRSKTVKEDEWDG